MIILAMRTDKPEAEVYLFDDDEKLAEFKWQAHRELSKTLHRKIDEVFETAHKTQSELDGIVIYKGPGSFTGLRIGFSVANAMASILKKPIVSRAGDGWVRGGIEALLRGDDEKAALPEYGSEAATTPPKK